MQHEVFGVGEPVIVDTDPGVDDALALVLALAAGPSLLIVPATKYVAPGATATFRDVAVPAAEFTDWIRSDKAAAHVVEIAELARLLSAETTQVDEVDGEHVATIDRDAWQAVTERLVPPAPSPVTTMLHCRLLVSLRGCCTSRKL